MKKIVLYICLCGLSLGLFSEPISAVKEGSAGLYGTDMDDVVSVTGWNSVFFDKMFFAGSYGHYQQESTSSEEDSLYAIYPNVLNLASMFKAGKTKIGLSYTGSIGNANNIFNVSTSQTGTNTTTKTTNIPIFHDIDVLVGIPKNEIGIRLGVAFGGSINDVVSSPIEQSTNSNSFSIAPSLAFGTTIRTRDRFVFTPNAEISFGIKNSGGFAASSFSSGEVTPGIGSDGKQYGEKRVYTTYTPAASVGVGIKYPSKNGIIKWSNDFEYTFSVIQMPEKFEWKYENGIKKEAIYRPDSGHSHLLTGSVSLENTVSWRFNLKAELSVDMGYSKKITGGSLEDTLDKVKSTITSTKTFILPILSAGTMFRINDYVSWFTGFGIRPIGYEYTNKITEDEKVVIADRTQNIAHIVLYPAVTEVGTGFQIQPTPEMQIIASVLLNPTDTSPFTSLGEFLAADFRLSFRWKDVPAN